MADTKRAKRRLGDYEILRELGRGGMGLVYEARQVSLNRKVALKILAGSLGITPSAVVRFRREAEAAAKLHHTNIVPVYGIGEEDGTHFYAMELIEGPSLNHVIAHMRRTPSDDLPLPGGKSNGDGTSVVEIPEWVGETLTHNPAQPGAAAERARAKGAMVKRSAAMPKRKKSGNDEPSAADSTTGIKSGGNYFDTIARMIAEVADGLDYAHKNGVIHRDMKPSNLMLAPDGRLSINDFGLARMLEQPGMTLTGEFMGSPLYMSPEQIVAGRMPLDHRTDIYSLGATLYELLTLQPPFPGETRDRIIAQIMTKEPASPRKVNKRVPLDLETICLKALERDPDQRYPTAGQFAEDLRRFVNRHAIEARRAGPVGRVVKWVRRRPAVAALIACVLVVGMGAATMTYRAHHLELAARATAGQQALDQALLEALSGRYDEMEPWLEKAEVLDVDPGRIRLLRGLAATELGDNEQALHHLELAAQQLPNSLGAKALLMRARFGAYQFDQVGKLAQEVLALTPRTPEDYLYGAWAIDGFEPDKAIKWLETLAEEHPTPAVHYMLGRAYHGRLSRTHDVSLIDETLAMVNAARATMPDNIIALRRHARAHLLAADIYKLEGDQARYGVHLDEATKTAKFMLEHHADAARSHQVNALLAAYQGDWESAITMARGAISRATSFDQRTGGLILYLYRLNRPREMLEVIDAYPDAARPYLQAIRALIMGELEGRESAEAGYDVELYGPNMGRAVRTHPFQIFAFLGDLEEARRRSREALERMGPSLRGTPFDLAVDDYVRGTASSEKLLEAVGDRTDRLLARHLIGLTHLAGGDRPAAIKEFEAIEREGNFVFGPGGAHLFLHRLREDPKWPPWIPVKPAPTTQPAG